MLRHVQGTREIRPIVFVDISDSHLFFNTKGLKEFIKFMRGVQKREVGAVWGKKLKSDLISKLGKKKEPFPCPS